MVRGRFDNFDNRSFGLNDEISVAAFDEELAARLHQDFVKDLLKAGRSCMTNGSVAALFERAHEWLMVLADNSDGVTSRHLQRAQASWADRRAARA